MAVLGLILDPCRINNGGCAHMCQSQKGKIMCSCRTGYHLAKDEKRCEDVDECSSEKSNICEQQCVNTQGNYRCSCYEGYRLLDQYRCEGTQAL
ncbi:PREDICTED: signal peptide, CUB and EGF-like domain-containing protein 3, partial [Priapulus caudatus]|uniref:Signal peptide, CUB and EGF-like domain-containing protein 3 n=1 Tax=Priapulus caudatus TaxID=37621 RepID=A0ABM1E0Z0_PRICU